MAVACLGFSIALPVAFYFLIKRYAEGDRASAPKYKALFSDYVKEGNSKFFLLFVMGKKWIHSFIVVIITG